jgi:cholesterol transport system auxiliary component
MKKTATHCITRAALSMAAALLLSACSLLPAPDNERVVETYTLSPSIEQKAGAHGATGSEVLALSKPAAAPGYDSTDMVYLVRPYQLQRFAGSRWVRPPAEMLAPLLMQQLAADGYYRALVPAALASVADQRLDVTLLTLQQEFFDTSSRVRVSLQVQLVDLRRRRVLATETFTEQEPAPDNDPYGGVVAANRAIGRILTRVAAFCRESEVRSQRTEDRGQGTGAERRVR